MSKRGGDERNGARKRQERLEGRKGERSTGEEKEGSKGHGERETDVPRVRIARIARAVREYACTREKRLSLRERRKSERIRASESERVSERD